MKKPIYITMILLCLLSLSYNIFFGLTNYGLDKYIIAYATIYSFVTRPTFYFSLLFLILYTVYPYININIDKFKNIFFIISIIYVFAYIGMVICHLLMGLDKYWKVLYFISKRMEIFFLMGAFMGIGLGKKIK